MKRAGSQGFTLIELVVTLLVLALAAAVAAPPVARTVESLRLRGEVAAVTSFLRAARERAITRRDAVEVVVEADGRALVLRHGTDSEAVRRLSALRIDVDPPGAPPLTFLPYGATTGGRFRLEAPGAVVYTVTVEPFTGRVAATRSES